VTDKKQSGVYSLEYMLVVTVVTEWVRLLYIIGRQVDFYYGGRVSY
jgi:hypothetical protein